MNIYTLKDIFDKIATNNNIEIEYKEIPKDYYNTITYGLFQKPNKITINNTVSIEIQIETEIHEVIHFFDVYSKGIPIREIIADYTTIQIYNHFDLPLSTYTNTQLISITNGFNIMVDKNVYNSIYNMIIHEIKTSQISKILD